MSRRDRPAPTVAVAPGERSRAGAGTGPGLPSKPIRIVIADDHALVREGTRRLLETHPDLRVVGETDRADEVVDLARSLSPDVVLLDVRLSGQSGIEATRRISASLPRVRVLMVSVCDDADSVRGALAAGAAGYLLKTVSGQELSEAVRTVAAGVTVLDRALSGRLGWGQAPAAPKPRGRTLTPRELEVLRLIADGCQNREIASRLEISQRTVERHCDNIFLKMGVGSRTEAVVHAATARLVVLVPERGR